MVICFSATPTAKSALDDLMGSGQFKDSSEAISMALINYQVIQKEVGGEGHKVIDASGSLATSSTGDDRNKAAAERRSPNFSAHIAVIPEIFENRNINIEAHDFVSTPETALRHTFNCAPQDWLWGQYNRFLPVKATCRAMLHLFASNPNGVPVDEATARISDAACNLGDLLSEIDARHLRRREEAMAAAFPTSAITGAQGRVRFGTQFVGTLKQGKLIGFPSELRLLKCDFAKEPRLLLTREGADFAALTNPVLDSRHELSTRTLFPEEIQFLLHQIKRFVPEEMSAFIALINAIEDGSNTPDSLDVYLRERFQLPNEEAIKQSFLATQRTGAISRMVELGLLERKKEGLRVTYNVTDSGKTLL